MTNQSMKVITTDIELMGESLDAYFFEDGTFRCGLSKLGRLLGYHPKVFLPQVMTRNEYTVALSEVNYSFDFLNVSRQVQNYAAKTLEITEPVITITLPDASVLLALESFQGNRLATEVSEILGSSIRQIQQINQQPIKGIAEIYHKQPPPPSYFYQTTIATNKDCWIYFIFDKKSQSIKIGYSSNPSQRLATLQVGNSNQLRLIKTIKGGVDIEHRLHDKFKTLKINGEWFQASQELLQFINELDY